MKTIRRTAQFRRDIKRMQRRRKDFGKLKNILQSLDKGEKLEEKYRDHVLVGQYKGTRECHLDPDWLLIYETTESEIVLISPGSHSDLFN